MPSSKNPLTQAGPWTGNREMRHRAPFSDHPVTGLLAGSSLPGVVLDLPDGGGDALVAHLADEPDGEVTQGCHDAGPGGSPDPGSVFTVGSIPDVLESAQLAILVGQ